MDTRNIKKIALSWIRKDLEIRGRVFSPNGVVGASKLRTPYIISMSFLESLINLCFESDVYLKDNYTLEKMDKTEVQEIGKYLFDFFEGVRLSIGQLNPNTKGTIGTEPEVNNSVDYWDIAIKTKHKQRLLHNVGLKAIVKGLLNNVMRSDKMPKSPLEVAEGLDHMRGIPWHHPELQGKKDDWVNALAKALEEMFKSKGIRATSGKYPLYLEKTDKRGNTTDKFNFQAFGWDKE